MGGIFLFAASRSGDPPKVFAAMLAFLLIRVLIEFSRENPRRESLRIERTVRPARPQKGVQMGELQVLPEGTCQVCGTCMKAMSVRCETCQTPHHPECWKYLGRCSTYGCKGKRAA
jgi:hypothetical protein